MSIKKHRFVQIGLFIISILYLYVILKIGGNHISHTIGDILGISFLGLLLITICVNIFYFIKDIISLIKKIRHKKLEINKKKVISILSIIIIVFIGIGEYFYNQSKKANLSISTIVFHKSFDNLSEKEKDYYLSMQANIFMYGQLKSPTTAVFSDPKKEHEENVILGNDDNTYIVIGYVDSQNSYGATIRSNFAVTIKIYDNVYRKNLDGYDYKVEKYDVNGQEMGNYYYKSYDNKDGY